MNLFARAGGRLRILFMCVAAAACAEAFATELWEKPWVEVRTPHFVLVSGLSEEESRELALGFERHRQGALALTGLADVFAEPTHVYYFPGIFHEGGLDGSTHIVAGEDYEGDYLLLRRAPRELEDRYHAWFVTHYVGRLLRGDDSPHTPLWYARGYPTLISWMRLEPERVVLGRPPMWALRATRRIEYLPLLRRSEGWALQPCAVAYECEPRWRQRTWLQSSMLMHLLVVDQGAGRRFAGESMPRYLAQRESGRAPEDAFAETFGLDPARLGGLVSAYKARGASFFEAPLPRADVTPAIRALSPAEAAERVGRACLANGADACAQRHFEIALGLDSRNADAAAGLATVHARAGDHDAAARLYERALALAPDDAWHAARYAENLVALAQPAAPGRDVLERAREQLRRAAELDRDNALVAAVQASLASAEGATPAQRIAILAHALALAPHLAPTKVALARAYADANREEEAVALARQVLSWAYVEEWESDDVAAAVELHDRLQARAMAQARATGPVAPR